MSEVKISQLPESTTVDNTVYIPIVQGTGTDTDNYKMKPSNSITKTDITTKLGEASASNDGYLSAAGWSLFNGKLDYRTFGSAANNNTGDFYATGSTVANSTLLEGHNSAYFQVAGNYAPASGSANYIQNNNSSAQSANMWISGNGYFGGNILGNTFNGLSGGDVTISTNTGGISNLIFKTSQIEALRIAGGGGAATFASTVNATQLQSTVATGTAPLTVNSTTMVSNLNAQYLSSSELNNFVYGSSLIGTNSSTGIDINSITPRAAFYTGYNNTNTPDATTSDYGYINIPLWGGVSSGNKTSLQIGGTYGYNTARIRNINSSGTGTWYDIYHSGNLTNTISTNYIPKWNGSSFVNSLISDDGTSMTLNGYITGTTGIRLNRSGYNTFQMAIDNTGLFMYDVTRGQYLITFKGDDGRVYIPSTTPSTSPTNGALVVGGGIGVGGNGYFNGDVHCGNIRATSSNSNFISSDVNIGYGSYQGYKLAVNGNIFINGNISATGEITAYSSSDERLKENIQPLNKSLELINKLNPVSYNWNEKAKELNPNKDDKTDVGVIAQELEKVLPNLVHNIYNDEFLAVDYVKLIPYLIGAIQELTQEINTLKNNK